MSSRRRPLPSPDPLWCGGPPQVDITSATWMAWALRVPHRAPNYQLVKLKSMCLSGVCLVKALCFAVCCVQIPEVVPCAGDCD